MDDTSDIDVNDGWNQHLFTGPDQSALGLGSRRLTTGAIDFPWPTFGRYLTFINNAFLRALTDQWQWSSIATIEIGTPNTVEVRFFDNIGNGHPNSRPDLGNPAAPLNSLGVDGGDFGVAGLRSGTVLRL